MNPPTQSILIVDDEPSLGSVIQSLLKQEGIASTYVSSGPRAIEYLTTARHRVDVVITDLSMPEMSGMELLEIVREKWPELPVVMLTAMNSVSTAVEAMRKGAYDFLVKPCDRVQITATLQRAFRESERRDEPRRHQAVLAESGLLGDSDALRDARERLMRVAESDATVLIRGESGTGKELAARLVHKASRRRAGPFVAANCGAFALNLLESEVFGHEKGAFTGATVRKPGRLELANNGTLFLDEIGDTPGELQVRLLRVLQERTFERVGGKETLKADVRFIAATHRNLEELIERGTFREDLFYRLNVVPVWLPPLRDRREDIATLARHFCQTFGDRYRRPEAHYTPDALEFLRDQPWPGNVRELQNLTERLVALASDARITREHIAAELVREPGGRLSPAPSITPPPAVEAARTGAVDASQKSLQDIRRERDREALKEALRATKNNRSAAARLLKVSRRTIYNMIEECGLEDYKPPR